MLANRRIVLIAAAAALVVASTSIAQVDRNVSLINLRNNTGQLANDFHLILTGVHVNDVYTPDGIYGPSYSSRAIYADGQGRVHIEWAGGTTAPGAWSQFGYALRGGVVYTSCEWYWTFNGQRIGDPLPDIFQDWVKVGGELRDIVRYRPPIIGPEPGPISIQRTAGYRETPTISSFFDIFTELSLPQPPNPVPIEPTPVVMPVNTSLVYTWQTPAWDPMYFMFYDLYDAGGLWAEFSNVAIVVPEPGALLAAPALLLFLKRARRATT